MRRLSCSTALAVVLWVIPTLTAWAQCPDPVDRIITFPEDGANSVPINAVLHVEFPSSQDPGGQPTWRVMDSRGLSINGVEDWDGLTATFIPSENLEPRSAYYVRVTVSATGQFLNFEFNTGQNSDRDTPDFSGLSELTWEHRDENWLLNNCSIWRGDAVVYRLSFPEASDDADSEHLCYHVYQTSGPGITGPTLVARVRYPGDDLHLLLPPERGEGDICFRVEARDINGRFDGNRRERCVEAVVGAVFKDACSIGGAAPRDSQAPWLVSFLAIFFWAGFRKWRGAHRPS